MRTKKSPQSVVKVQNKNNIMYKITRIYSTISDDRESNQEYISITKLFSLSRISVLRTQRNPPTSIASSYQITSQPHSYTFK